MEFVTRQKAILAQLPRYYTGVLCKHGHRAERATKTGVCIQCNNMRSKQRTADRNALHPIVMKTYRVHVDDVVVMREFAEALRLARTIGGGL